MKAQQIHNPKSAKAKLPMNHFVSGFIKPGTTVRIMSGKFRNIPGNTVTKKATE